MLLFVQLARTTVVTEGGIAKVVLLGESRATIIWNRDTGTLSDALSAVPAETWATILPVEVHEPARRYSLPATPVLQPEPRVGELQHYDAICRSHVRRYVSLDWPDNDSSFDYCSGQNYNYCDGRVCMQSRYSIKI